MSNELQTIYIDDTNFMHWGTNFAGDPRRSKFGSSTRTANIIIPDEDLALRLLDEGFNVKKTSPRDGEEEGYESLYHTPIIAKYEAKYPPKIYLVSGDAEPVLLDSETVGEIDQISVKRVRVSLNPYHNPNTGKLSLYIRVMYVEQDCESDPYAKYYRR